MRSEIYQSMDVSRLEAGRLPVLEKTSFQAAIFDLDGTLVNSEGPYLIALRAALTERGMNWRRSAVNRLLYGRSWFDVYRTIESMSPGLFTDVNDLTDAVEQQMLSPNGPRPTMISGSVRLLTCLAKLIPTSIVSGSSRAQVLSATASLGIVSDLAFCMGFEDYEAGKPSPSGFKEAARRMNAIASSCVVFEDSSVGVEAARRAGMFCIGLAQQGAEEQDLSEAHLVVDDLCDPAVLEALG